VVDDQPRFHLDALRWFGTLTEAAGVDVDDLVVHVVGPDSSEPLDYLRARGVAIRSVEAFDPRSPHCNKISAALKLAEETVDGMAVLCDTDLAVLEDPRRLTLPTDGIAGKPVDAPVPPLEVLMDIFGAAGLEVPPLVSLPWGPDSQTVRGNNNGGLYLVPGALLSTVASSWSHWARWLLDRRDLLGTWTVYLDQVAMALGLAAEHLGSERLDVRWNTPVHDPTRIPPDAPRPAIIHYHQEVDGNGRIRATGHASIDGQVEAANRAIDEVWARAAPDLILRRRSEAGAGPQADTAEPVSAGPQVEAGGPTGRDHGDATVAALEVMVRPATVLEFGPDGQPLKRLGQDNAGPDGAVPDGAVQGDLVISRDALVYLAERSDYLALVEALWHATLECLVVTGLEVPNPDRPGHHFHEPLSATLGRVAPDAEVYPLGPDGGATLFVVLRSPANRHDRDFSPATLAPLVGRHPDPLSLITLRLQARRTTGFYPDHAPRLWEYPVVATLITDLLSPGSRIMDVGAGVTPLPPYLTSRGYVVDTVDPSPTVRDWSGQTEWNEWGFLDYGAAGLAHRSWNCTLDHVPPDPPFDGVYSVSVIEHMPADDRRALLADMAARTRPEGLVVLTIDLVRGEDDLWNRNLGVQVEDPERHGTFQDVIDESVAVGLRLVRRHTVRAWGDVDVDIGLLALRRMPPPSPDRRPRRDLRSIVRRLWS
jgi:hypothetical protein